MTENILGNYNYIISIILMMIGLHIVINATNMIKIILGMNIFQTSVFIFYISMGKVIGGKVPILSEEGSVESLSYTNPLTSVLILTAIVVSVASVAIAFALICRIHKEYNTIDVDEIIQKDEQDDNKCNISQV